MIDKCYRMSSSKACSSFIIWMIISSSLSMSEAKQMVEIHPCRTSTTRRQTPSVREEGTDLAARFGTSWRSGEKASRRDGIRFERD
jgi:hypothetical protein